MSSHALAAVCDIGPSRMRGDSTELHAPDYAVIEQGDAVYVTATQLPAFIEQVLPSVTNPFVLVTGDADAAVPTDLWQRTGIAVSCFDFIDDPHLLHWFAQNCDLRHPRITPMPIGLDYHTLAQAETPSPWGSPQPPAAQDAELREIARRLPPLERRPLHCLVGFHFSLFGDRIVCLNALHDKPFVRIQRRYLSRRELWQAHGDFSFVASPRGNGMDCHRTWEALALGAIPIVRSSPLDPVFEGLPVLIVDDWRQVDDCLLSDFRELVLSRSWQLEKLEMAYWRDLIRSKTRGTVFG